MKTLRKKSKGVYPGLKVTNFASEAQRIYAYESTCACWFICHDPEIFNNAPCYYSAWETPDDHYECEEGFPLY